MNKKQQELFIAFFEEIHQAEQAYETIKNNMAHSLAYNPYLLFELISARNQSITIDQFRSYLNDRVAYNERELYELFQKFDWTRQGFISREDFVREITPFGKPLPGSTLKGTVTAQVQGQFIALLMQFTKRLRIIQVARKQVAFIAPYNAFKEIDYLRSGLIGLGQLQRFFNVNDFMLSQNQVYLLLHGLRRRCYLQVNLQVFCENLDPLEFGQYEAYSKYIEGEEQRQFLTRSRRQQETMRRSRMQSQKIEHHIQKQERRKRAELERELELEERIKKEISHHEQQKDRHLRRAILEEDKNIRWNVEGGNRIIEQQRYRNNIDRQRNMQKSLHAHEQRQINEVLARSAIHKEDELEASRKARIYERQLAQRQLLQKRRQQIKLEEVRRQQLLQRQSREREEYERRREILRRNQLFQKQRQGRETAERVQHDRRRQDIRREMIEKQSRIQLQDKVRRQQQETASRSRYSNSFYHY